MPKYASQYKSGSYNRKPVGYSKALTTASNLYAMRMAKKAASAPLSNRGFSSMNVLQNREKKFYDINTASYACNTTGSFTLLHIPQLGSDYNNRIGRKTLLKSLYIRGYCYIDPAAAISTNVVCQTQLCRFIIFVDNQPNGATPSVTDLLTESLPQSQLNPNNRDRFKIIKDKQFVFDPVYQVDTATQARCNWNRTTYPIKIYKKLNIETVFNGTNGSTIGDINTGALYMMMIGSTAAGAADATFSISTRCRFDDA